MDGWCRLVRYHLGTVAFGSFIIALVQLIRLIMHYIESRVKVPSISSKKILPLILTPPPPLPA